ncbi:hypothetical protein GGR50DRAFT_667115 [Xylaria sp. CBS 124048]|nr:hypothetical protein GGR50DRAFT_667115 [Xylaria sp. CBS 124048]
MPSYFLLRLHLPLSLSPAPAHSLPLSCFFFLPLHLSRESIHNANLGLGILAIISINKHLVNHPALSYLLFCLLPKTPANASTHFLPVRPKSLSVFCSSECASLHHAPRLLTPSPNPAHLPPPPYRLLI